VPEEDPCKEYKANRPGFSVASQVSNPPRFRTDILKGTIPGVPAAILLQSGTGSPHFQAFTTKIIFSRWQFEDAAYFRSTIPVDQGFQ